MEHLIRDPRIHWSPSRERTPLRAERTVLEVAQQSRPQIQNSFFDVVGAVRARISRHEEIEVYWWGAPFAYIEVKDKRWKHYPCYSRMLVSFDFGNGKCASPDSKQRYAFARRGWLSFANSIVGQDVCKFTDCGQPEKTESC